jgi:hypothetical protein
MSRPTDPNEDPEITALQQEYQQLLHAMQSGVKFEQELGMSDAQSPKHLRVGVNSAITQNSGLVILLVEKGVITWREYWQAQIDAFRREVAGYEQRLSEFCERPVTLG